MSEEARDRILSRVREANRDRPRIVHPGLLPHGLEPPIPFRMTGRPDALDAFTDRFTAAGGEVVRLIDEEEAARWLEGFGNAFETVSVCHGVPDFLRPALRSAAPEEAALGVSMAVGAAAQTGSLVLSSREGRRPQLLPPVHLVWVHSEDIYGTLGEALRPVLSSLPAVLALHSGPSKSADIGQIMVTGVHGPGRVIAAVVGSAGAA